MARRSRSQRPPKVRNSEAPRQDLPPEAKTVDPIEERSQEPSAATPIDELAALDAGWDDLPA
ncbi:MAG TPA: hypothetical protein VN894_03040 [Polyangiaceae bacterium]|nr:hypothetical protein [Polyangiaceae bacterium]